MKTGRKTKKNDTWGLKVTSLIVVFFLLIGLVVLLQYLPKTQDIRQKAAPATTLSFTPYAKTVVVGDEFTVDLTIDTGTNSVSAVVGQLQFDASKIEILDIANTTTFINPINNPDYSTPNSVYFIFATSSPQQPFHGTGTVATLRLKALAMIQPTLIQFMEGTAVYALGEPTNDVLVGTTPLSITISPASGTVTQPPRPTATLTPIPSQNLTPPECGVMQSSLTGTAPYTLTLIGNGSASNSAAIQGYRFDFDGNGTWDTGFIESGSVQHTYTTPGTFLPKFQIVTSTNVYSDICEYTASLIISAQVTPAHTPTNTPTFAVTPTTTPTPIPGFTPTPTPRPIELPTPPFWWEYLPERLRGFLEQLYVTVFYYGKDSTMKDLLDGIFN